jgi:hypothetical protein
MITFPLMDCCELLTIDPKTLRHWLKQAKMPLSIHPTDARVKCLTREQVQQLAVLHGRIFKPDEAHGAPFQVETSPPEARQEFPHPHMMSEMAMEKTPSAVLLPESNLSQKLSHLEAQVAAQQQQLVLLTQALLLERELRSDRHLSSGEVSAHPMAEPEILPSRHENLIPSVPIAQSRQRSLHPAEQRARFLVLPPLIEYSASGTYVVISSQEGEILLIPDSPEWFEWFRTLSSFRFVGASGHFGACRGYDRRPTRTWYAHRTLHQHNYRHYLGLSEHLTIAHLEQMAAKLQSYV